MNTFDHWKTTEPESGYDPPEPSIEDESDRTVGQYEDSIKALSRAALQLNSERIKYEDALRKIVEWKSYAPHNTAGRSSALNLYEEGANNMLKTLQAIAAEVLGS